MQVSAAIPDYRQKQHTINFFIADFYCAEKKLVVEVDGRIHDHQKHYDEQRDLILNKKNLKVLRIKNEELQDMEKLKQKIKSNLI